MLSPHFSLEELTHSDYAKAHGIDNTPPENLGANAVRLAEALEGVRSILGVPMAVSSGYRCPELNEAIGGKPTSAHKDFRAADFLPIGLGIKEAFDKLVSESKDFDQIILERDKQGHEWIHFAIAASGESPREMVLSGTKGGAITRVTHS